MGLINRFNQRAKKFSIFDVKLAQIVAMLSALIIAKLLPAIMTIDIWWFIGLFILCFIKPFYVFWIKENSGGTT